MTEEQIKHKAEQKYKQHLADPNYCENSEEESFYTGYVEGYLECQKANDWHYPSKGELPKEHGWYWIQYLNGTFDCLLFTQKKKFIDKQCVDSTDSVYAWKEIVLPKEIEQYV